MLNTPKSQLRVSPQSLHLSELDQQGTHEVLARLPEHVAAKVLELGEKIQKTGGGRIVLDSDGTGFFTIDSGNPETDAAYLEELRAAGRLFPDGGIRGETKMEFMYDLRPTSGGIGAWQRLSEHGVNVGILTGRKEADLQRMYREALDHVPNFEVLPSKGRAIVQQGRTELLPALRERLEGDPLRAVARQMIENIIKLVPEQSREAARGIADPLSPAGQREFQDITGYRVSPQEVAGSMVLIRLHHRWRACQLAHEAGCDVAAVSDPSHVDGEALASWLNSESPPARAVLQQLHGEDARIQAAWEQAVAAEHLQSLAISRKDHVGYKSLSQDLAPDISYSDVLRAISPVLAYGGDSFGPTGNDRPIMEALRTLNPEAVIFAVTDRPESAEQWMTPLTQYELFLAQYALSRVLDDAKRHELAGVASPALQESQFDVHAAAAAQLGTIPAEVGLALRGLNRQGFDALEVPKSAGMTSSWFFDAPFVQRADQLHVSPRDFLLAYVEVHNQVSERAHAILAGGASLAELRKERDLMHRLTSPLLASDIAPAEDALSVVNQEIRRRILTAARPEGSQLAQAMALDLACMQLQLAEETALVAAAMEEQSHATREHAAILREARSEFGPASDFDEMFVQVLEQKYLRRGRIPDLVLVNDIDSNLAPGEHYNSAKPSSEVDRLLDALVHPAHPGTPIAPRVPLAHLLLEDRTLGTVAPELYRDAGRRIRHEIFDDAIATARLAAENGIRFDLLSSNLQLCAEGVREVVCPPGAPGNVIGVTHEGLLGIDKPVALAREFAANPDAVIVLTDDSNGAVRTAIQRGSILPEMTIPLPIEDIILFVSRVPGQDEPPTPHKLQQLLEEREIPHGVNFRQVMGDEVHGYQGTKRLLELYLNWRAERT